MAPSWWLSAGFSIWKTYHHQIVCHQRTWEERRRTRSYRKWKPLHLLQVVNIGRFANWNKVIWAYYWCYWWIARDPKGRIPAASQLDPRAVHLMEHLTDFIPVRVGAQLRRFSEWSHDGCLQMPWRLFYFTTPTYTYKWLYGWFQKAWY
jgi:hypothetical protein